MLDQLVHLVDGALQILAGILILHQTAAVHSAGCGLAVHNVDLGSSGSDGEHVVVVSLRSAKDIVSGCSTLTKGDLEHRDVGGLDGVDQALAKAQELSLLCLVVDVDTGGILDPDHRDAVTVAQGDELVHLDQALTVQLAAHTHSAFSSVLRIVRIALQSQDALTVRDDADQQAVDLCQTGDHLGAVVLLVLQELAAVEQSLHDIVHVIGLSGVSHDDVVQSLAFDCRRLRHINTEELRIEGRDIVHVLLDGIQNAELLRIDLAEETGDVVVDGDGARRVVLHLAGRIDHALSTLKVNVGLGVHAADDAGAADCHVALLMGDQDGRGDGVIAAACGVGSVDTYDDRNAHLVQLGVAVEGGAAASAVRIHLLLLVQLNAGAVQDVDQRDAQHLCGVGAAEQVVCLARDPCAGHLLVIGSDDHRPLAVDAAKALDDAGGDDTDLLLLVVLRVVDGVQRAEGTRIDQLVDSLKCGVLALLVDLVIGRTGGEHLLSLGVDLFLDLLQLGDVVRVRLVSRRIQNGHVLKISRH